MRHIETIARKGLFLPRAAIEIGGIFTARMAEYNHNFWQQTNELLFPPESTQFANRLKVYRPLHDATVGFNTIRYGERKGDQELIYFGGAMAVKAVVNAYESREVPSAITSKIVDGILENEIVPEEQPLLSDEMIERSHPPIHKYGKTVIHLFPSGENRL